MSTEPLDPAHARAQIEHYCENVVSEDSLLGECFKVMWADYDRLAEAFAAERERVQRVEVLFAGGPDTSCRTVWRTFAPWGCSDVTECVEVPMDDLRTALADDTKARDVPGQVCHFR